MKTKNIFIRFLLLCSLHSYAQRCVSGDCINGFGTFIYSNGDKYTGGWKYSQVNGQGTYTYTNGDKWIGEWKNGQQKRGYKVVQSATTPKPSAPADLTVSNIVFNDNKGNDNQLLDADENAEIKFTVLNSGKGEAYNLVAEIEEVNKVKGIQFLKEKTCGNLLPGKEMPICIPVSGNMQLVSGRAEFQITIREGNHFDADPFKISLNTQEFKYPDVVIADYKFTSNEEGKIKLGNTVSLNMVIQNKGQGDASDINIGFVNPENVFPANETRYYIPVLKPNESKTVKYEFFANKRYIGSEIPIRVLMSERYRKYGDNRTLTISLEQNLSKTQHIDVNTQYEKPIKIDNVSLTSDVDKNIPLNNSVDENKFALIIGNEDYSSFQPNLTSEMNVEYANNDALVFKEYCVKTFGVPEKNVTCILNATAGKLSQAIDKINKLIQVTNGKANVIVYYAGHGLPDEITKEPYLIPVDVSGSNVASAIKLSSLYQKLTEFPSQQITVFMDACFSGGGREAGLLAVRGVKITPKADYLNGNIVVFTASSGEESSLPWKEKQHGMFTYFLLKKFQETNGDVSLSELDLFLKNKVELESVRTNNKTQNPQVLFSPEEIDKWKNVRLK